MLSIGRLERVYEHILTTFDYMARARWLDSFISSKRMRYDSALAQFPNGFFADYLEAVAKR